MKIPNLEGFLNSWILPAAPGVLLFSTDMFAESALHHVPSRKISPSFFPLSALFYLNSPTRFTRSVPSTVSLAKRCSLLDASITLSTQ